MAEHKLITSLLRPFYGKAKSESFSLPGAIHSGSKLLCIDSGDLSELLFHAPFLTAVKRRFPRAELDFLIPENHSSLVIAGGLAKQCIIYKERQLNPWRPSYSSLLRKLGAKDYDVALVMSFSPQPRLELAALACGAPLRVGPSHADSWPAINFEMRPQAEQNGYLGDRLRGMSRFLGFSPEEFETRWPLPTDRVRQTAQQVHFHKPNPDQMLIGIDPGVGKAGHAFALENLEFLVRQLSSQLVCKILPLGLPDANDRLEKFETRLSEIPVGLNRESLLDMVLLLAQCDLFLAGNTDFFHFAAALNIPTIGLFSARDQSSWAPAGRQRVKVLKMSKGEKVDIETLMEAVESVTQGKTTTASTVITESATAEGEALAVEDGADPAGS